MKAVGIHVFAGGFTMGVKQVLPVECQLEVHGFGTETAEAVAGVPFINSQAKDWPVFEGELAYGNPRCTGFSCVTSGYGEDTHGAFAKQTRDIVELSEYAAGRFDCVVWESVQQAFTTGRPLINWLIEEIFAPRHYRIAHLFLNAASFGNAQQRKRYFFVAYRDDRNFNITPPEIPHWKTTVYDAIGHLVDRPTREYKPNATDYDFDSYVKLHEREAYVVPVLPNGWDHNAIGRYAPDLLHPYDRERYKYRTSDMPFSMHCVCRINWKLPSPTLTSTSGRLIHPDLDRPLTVGELSTIMGWPDIPRGKNPIAQIAKGIAPSVGKWLAEQAVSYLNNDWGGEDWESSYDAVNAKWVGRDTHGALEKTFNLTSYVPQHINEERYAHVATQSHRFHVALAAKQSARSA